jgi:hypothetical protein
MTQQYPKRLIEVDLPIKRISAHARREKSIRHGHISTLHIWWARRPLAACRAVICAALWPDPVDPLCPQDFRDKASKLITEFAAAAVTDRALGESCDHETWVKWQALVKNGGLDGRKEAHWNVLRFALLDFIADFANWDNSTVKEYLETSRSLTQAAHEALGGEIGTRPLVVDPFAGGGSIPLEALRCGADAFASDLNPVPVILNKIVLEYIPKYGKRLGEEVRKRGDWIRQRAENELSEFYPDDADGAKPIAFLWARTILSDAPSTEAIPIEVPLLSSLWLSKKPHRGRALRWVRDDSGKVKCTTVEQRYQDGRRLLVRKPLLEVFEPVRPSEVEPGTVKRGSTTCPVTGFTTQVAQVRTQLQGRRGGTRDARLICVVTTRPNEQGRFYRVAIEKDSSSVSAAECALTELVQTRGGSFPSTLIQFIVNELVQVDEIQSGISPNLLVRNWPPAFKEWSTKAVRDAFYASPLFPRLLNPESIKETIARGVSNGQLAYVGKIAGGKYHPFSFERTISTADIEISEEMFIITKEAADAYRKESAGPSSVALTPPASVSDAGGTPETKSNAETPGTFELTGEQIPLPKTRLKWSGEIPPQKWMNFYTKVLAKLGVNSGLTLTVTVDCNPPGGVSPQKTEEIKSALRELGLNDRME